MPKIVNKKYGEVTDKLAEKRCGKTIHRYNMPP